MKRAIALLALLLIALSGCQWTQVLPEPEVALRVISAAGVISPPTSNGMPIYYDANVQPGDKIVLVFATGVDQYGNLVGLTDDTRWTIREVRIRCDEKVVEDTVFWPANVGPNACVWFPGWTAPTEIISGLPLPMYPLEGYPWDACGSHDLPDMPSQAATIEVLAEAEWIEVELALPGNGNFLIEWPGEMIAERTAGPIAARRLSEPGEIVVTQGASEWRFVVPIDRFWVDAEFKVRVGPTGVC